MEGQRFLYPNVGTFGEIILEVERRWGEKIYS